MMMNTSNERFLSGLLLILMVIAIPLSCAKAPVVSEHEVSVQVDENPALKPFSVYNLQKHMKDLGIKFRRVVLAQAFLESGYFTSAIFLENNNMFGMKCARRRMTTHQGERRGHAYFATWQDCVMDYAYFQNTYAYHIDTEEEYFEYLSDNYAEDPSYVYKLKDIIRQNNLKH